jgi:hypothetical protein
MTSRHSSWAALPALEVDRGSLQDRLAVIFVVLEEVYAIGPDGRKLVGRSERLLLAGDRQAAHTFAKSGAAQFDAVDYHVDQPGPFFSGHNVKRELHLFIIKPAMPA